MINYFKCKVYRVKASLHRPLWIERSKYVGHTHTVALHYSAVCCTSQGVERAFMLLIIHIVSATMEPQKLNSGTKEEIRSTFCTFLFVFPPHVKNREEKLG